MKIVLFLKNLLKAVHVSFFTYGLISCSSYMGHAIRIERYVQINSVSFVQEQISSENVQQIVLDGEQYCFDLKNPVKIRENHGYKELDKVRIKFDNEVLQNFIDGFAVTHANSIKVYRIALDAPSLHEVFLILTIWAFVASYISSDIEENEDMEKKKQGRVNVTFNDILGLKETKKEIKELLSLYNESAISTLKMRKPKGVLFYGSPGNGKTMMAKAISNEFGGGFFYISASELMEIYVGVGPKKIRDIFNAAKQEETAVIFIDELDAIAAGRKEGNNNSELHNTLNQLLVEMDGMETSSNILVIGATNMRNIFDEALKRRFELQIDFDNPNQDEIIEFLKHLLKDIPSQNINVEYIASGLENVSRANVVSIVENAKRIACANNRFYLISEDLDEATLRHDMGRVTTGIKMPSHERWKTAYHEAGHAFMFYYYYKKGAFLHPPRYLTIIPRAHALGFVAPPSSDDYQSKTIRYITAEMQVCYGGLICEEMFCPDSGPSTGCSSDLMYARGRAEEYVNFGLDANMGYVGVTRRSETLSNNELNDKFDRIRLLCEQNINAAREILSNNRKIIEVIARAAIHFGYLTQDLLIGIMEGKIGDSSYALVPIKKHEFVFFIDD